MQHRGIQTAVLLDGLSRMQLHVRALNGLEGYPTNTSVGRHRGNCSTLGAHTIVPRDDGVFE